MFIVSTFRQFPRSIFLLISVLYTTARACGQTAPPEQWQAAIGTWTLTSVYLTNNVEGPSPSQQKKLLGTNLSISPGMLKSCDQSVPISSAQLKQVSPDDFLFNTRVRFKQLGVSATSITEITFNKNEGDACFSAFPLPGQDIYIKDKNELLVDFAGVFYRAVRKASGHG